MPGWPDQVRDAYNADPEAEWDRLEGRVQNRIEHLVTMHAIGEVLPPPGPAVRVLDAGAGPGRYTIALAERGYLVTLLDLSEEHVRLARQRIEAAGPVVASRVEATVAGSFTDLAAIESATFDAVLCLGGAVSHVVDADLRLQALREMARVARPGAPVVVSAGNLLSNLRGIVAWPYLWETFAQAWSGDEVESVGYLENGAPYREFMPEDFVEELETAGLRVERLFGCQGIAAHLDYDNLEALMADGVRWPLWRRWLLATCDHPNVIGVSCHLIAAARV